MEAIEVLPEMKLPAEPETDEYAKRIAYWKEQALNDTGQTVWGLQQSANAVNLLQCERDIVVGIRTIGEQFLTIGKNLTEIQTNHLHFSVPMRDDSWIQSWSFEDYVERKFGFKKSTAYALVGVYREFGTSDCKLKEEYAGFGYSQLVEMLPMAYTERQKVTASMTVKEIREIRQNGERRAAIPPKPIEPVTVESVEVIAESENSEQSVGFQTSGQASPVCNAESNDSGITYFKNDSERRAFLNTYRTWPAWLQIPQLALEVYRVQLTDGAQILGLEYTEREIVGIQKRASLRQVLAV